MNEEKTEEGVKRLATAIKKMLETAPVPAATTF